MNGRSYYFAAAIQGPDPRVSTSHVIAEKAGLIPGTVWAFCPAKQGPHQGDCHKVFDGKSFVAWWKNQLLPNLHQPSIIMLDNAKYHLVKKENAPNAAKMKKEELRQFLLSKNLELEHVLSITQFREMAKDWINTNVSPEVVSLAEAEGHKVLFTPSYISGLQPIELVWDFVKGNVGRQYNTETTLDVVYRRLMAEFERLEQSGHASVKEMIEKCAATAKEMFEDMQHDDDSDEYDSAADNEMTLDDEDESQDEEDKAKMDENKSLQL